METKSEKSGSNLPPQAQEKHPPEWQADLNPSHMAGQNIGQQSDALEHALPNAYDVKDVHRTLNRDFADDELRQITLVPGGTPLQQGATYVDLADPDRREFTARGDMQVEPDHWYVPKDQVPYSLWNRLRGVDDPERIAERRRETLDA